MLSNANISFSLGNYSNSSMKLLEKIILLAATLERRAISKFPSINFDCWRKRRLILFTALTVISNKFGLGSKLLQLDWLVELLSQIICKIRLDLAVKIIKSEGGLKKLVADLRQARKLQVLQVLRASLRKDNTLKHRLLSGEPQNFLVAIEKRKRLLIQSQIAKNNAKLEYEIANLRLEDPNEPRDTLKRFLHIWRCILNLRLVKSRTRKRVKSSIISRWRRSTRVSTIAGIYHGKKVKLRLMNRWFSKRFGKAKEHQLTLRLNDFIGRKKRRAMFLTREEVSRSHALTAKGLFLVWRHELQERRAQAFHVSRLLKGTFKRLTGCISLSQGRAQTSRLYNEIRLLKNCFYNWFSAVIPDRFVFERDRMILARNERKTKAQTLLKWIRKSRSIVLLEQQCNQLKIAFKNRQMTRIFSNWNLLTKQHSARLIWTENFRLTEDLRQIFKNWRSQAKNQVTADTKYQFNLCKNSLNVWRGLFDEKQENRFQLKRFFSSWKYLSIERRGIRFLRGQELLRCLSRLKVPNETLAKALECSNEESSSTKTVTFFKWKHQLKQLLTLKDCGNVFLLDKIKKILQIWRLKTAELNVIESEPIRMKSKVFTLIKKLVASKREKCEALDGQLFHYYASRAVKLEGLYFHRWESAFQVTQVGEHCCLQILKLWESQQRAALFKRWQVQTAGIIFEKCKRITGQQGMFTIWRRSCSAERSRRSLRIISKHFQSWRHAHKQRSLESRQIKFHHLKCKLGYFTRWKREHEKMIQSWSRANDFYFIVRGSRSIDLWKQKLEALRTARLKTQTLLLLRAPIVRKPRIEQLMANAVSLSDLKGSKDDEGHLIMENLNIAELSV